MRTRTQAAIMKYSIAAPVLLLAPIFVLTRLIPGPQVLCGSLVAFFAVPLTLWYGVPALPIHCDTPGCKGRVQRTSTRQSPVKVRLHYSCPVCGDVHEVDVIAPEPDFRP